MPQHNGPSKSTTMETAAAIRVVLADSKPIHQLGMNLILAGEEDIRVVAHVETLPSLHAVLEQHLVDVVVLESELLSGSTAVISELVRRSPETKLIVHVLPTEQAKAVELYGSGAQGVVHRSIAPELLVKCVRKVSDGETWIDNASISKVIVAYRSQRSGGTQLGTEMKLSAKENAIVGGVTRGLRNKEIAYQIRTTEQVVKNSLNKIFGKLGVTSRHELALRCLHNKAIEEMSGVSDNTAVLTPGN